jgi:hypothetical protein
MAKYRIDGFEQIKAFYCWVFNNPDKVRPTHISLYLFLWNQGNRAHWVEWFKCPYDLAMQGACIGNNGTYYRCLDDLKKFGLIDYQKGVNNFKAPLINLFKLYDSEQLDVPLSEQLTIQQPEQQHVQQPEQQHVQQPEQQHVQQPEQQHVHIYKLITNNLVQITNNYDKVETFILSLSDTSKPEPKNYKKILLSEIIISDFPQLNEKYIASAKHWQKFFMKNLQDAGASTKQIENAKGIWIDDIRLMIETDGYSFEDFREVYDFLSKNSFWKKNILSTSKLREKMAQLKLEIKNPQSSYAKQETGRDESRFGKTSF